MAIYLPKNKGVWAEATGQLESRLGPRKLLRKVVKAAAGGEAGEAAAQTIISTLVEKKRKIK